MDVSEWISKSNPSIIEDVSIPTDVMFKLKDMVKNKPWYRKMKAKYA
jgi:hypothetical protein